MRYKVVKRSLWRQQKGRCHYCQQRLQREDRAQHNFATLDHVVPKSILPIGVHLNDNFVLACSRCNAEKGDLLPEEWNQRVGDYRLVSGGWIWDPENSELLIESIERV